MTCVPNTNRSAKEVKMLKLLQKLGVLVLTRNGIFYSHMCVVDLSIFTDHMDISFNIVYNHGEHTELME